MRKKQPDIRKNAAKQEFFPNFDLTKKTLQKIKRIIMPAGKEK